MNSDDKHSESEFYYPIEHFTFAALKRKEVLAPGSTMESLTSPEQFCENQKMRQQKLKTYLPRN